MAVITIGEAAIDRTNVITSRLYTHICKGNPADGTGKITQINIYPATTLYNVEVATFFEVTPNHFSTRDTAIIGNIGAGSQSVSVELDVQAGDFIGIYSTGPSGQMEYSPGGYGGLIWLNSDQIPCTNVDFGTVASGVAISLGGTGVTPVLPTATVQAVTDRDETTATGNGNITNTGYAWGDVTKRGIVYDTSSHADPGDTAPADTNYTYYEEETGSFNVGAFTRPLTGLLRGERYYVRAYAYNTEGYDYSNSEVNFYTYPSVDTYAPTDIIRADPTVVTANALVELDVVENITTRGYKYGLTEADTWDESENGGGTYTEGTFSLQLTGLTDDLTYYIRAYTIGAWGTKYGSYVEFKTAYPYGSFKTVIEAEATASAVDIATVGGKQSLLIENHLIQNQTVADLIANAYLAEYKNQKTKLVVTRPCPAPYEIGDTIERVGARIPYAPAATAVISYAPAATAVHPYGLAGRDMLIRKISISFSAGNYVSIIELED